MTGKEKIATATLVVLAAGGLSYAADGGNPLLKIAEALNLIDDHTSAIADQTSTLTKQTTTVAQQTATIENQTAALANANQQLDQKLDAVLNLIGKIEVPPPPPPPALSSPAHTVWLAPYVDQLTINGHSTFASIRVLNVGVVPATITCDFFSRDDGHRFVGHQTTFTLEPGVPGGCSPKNTTLEPPVVDGWSIIISDNPVVVTGSNRRTDDGTFSIAENMIVRPIDCDGDQTGIELFCDTVEKIRNEQ